MTQQTNIDGYDFCRRCQKVFPSDEVARLRVALSGTSGYIGTNGEIVVCPECEDAVANLIEQKMVTSKTLPNAWTFDSPEVKAVKATE